MSDDTSGPDPLLGDATTDEIFMELYRRNDAVVLLCYKYEAEARELQYRKWAGSWAMILGLLELAKLGLQVDAIESLRQHEDDPDE